MTRYEAHVQKGWQTQGMAHLLVGRIRDGVTAEIGVFLLDLWCLGVKDAMADFDLPASEFDQLVAERLPPVELERLDPACAKKLIDGAIAYAEALGFSPHRDFRKARRVLSGLNAGDCPTEFVYGCEGRPCFVRGPEDSDERVERVLAALEARCGLDGFDYVGAEDEEEGGFEEDEVDEARFGLRGWLEEEPDDVPRFYEVSGMITAMQVCPTPVSPTELLSVLWGPEGRVWKSEGELREFTELLARYWNVVADLIDSSLAEADTGTPPVLDIWSDDFEEDDKTGYVVAFMDWASGFMRATTEWPDAWGNALTRPDLAEHWEVVRWWAAFLEAENREQILAAAQAKPQRSLPASTLAIAKALRPPMAGPVR